MSTSCVTRPTLTETLLETLTELVTTETESITTIPGETSVVTEFSCLLSASVPGSDVEVCISTTEILSTTIEPPEIITTQVPITIPITTTATAFRTEFTTSCTTIRRPDRPDDNQDSSDDPNDGSDNGNDNNGGNGNNNNNTSRTTGGGGNSPDPTPDPGNSPSPSPSDPPPLPTSSPTNTDTTLPPSVTPGGGNPGNTQEDDRISGGELGPIIGGALGGFFGLIAIVALIWFILRRRKRWDDIFEKDFDVSLPSSRRKKRFSLDIDDTPKPYQYGLVGHVQPPSPPPTKTSFGGASLGGGGASLGGAAAAMTPDEMGNRLVDPFAAGPFASQSNAGAGAALAGGLAVASAPLTPGAYSNAPSSRPSTAGSMDPLVGRHAGQRSISATSSSHQQHSSNMSYDANLETRRLLAHSPSPSFTLGSAPIPMRSITPTSTSPFASTSFGLPPGARPPALYTSNPTPGFESTAFPATDPFIASSPSPPADTNTTTKSPPTSPQAWNTNNSNLLDFPDRKATGSPLSFQEAPRRLQVTNPNQRESSVPSMFSPVNSVFSERLGAGQGFGEETLAALGAAASGVNPERQGSWEGARLRKNSR